MLEVKCINCGSILDRPGAILWSPPRRILDKIMNRWEQNMSKKYHFCSICFRKIEILFVNPKYE